MNATHLIATCEDPASATSLLRSTKTIRERAQGLLARARGGASRHFTVHDAALDEAASLVADVTLERYPDLNIPYHSRWRHFEAGGIDRRALLNARLGANATPAARARAQIDLALVSVLLDAGAGPDWKYVEPASGQTFTRSEGLAVASFHAFTAGLFSSDAAHPLQVDAMGLRGMVTDRLAQAFQVQAHNPLVGLEGRATLLHRLGEVLATQPATFGETGRPGTIFDLLTNTDQHATPSTAEVSAHGILSTLLDTLSDIWPAHNTLAAPARPGRASDTIALGDCWRHAEVPGPGLSAGWMPFHKLSQWLTYSLLEPFEWAGVVVTGLDALTGLPEYRNGGLMIDTGVLQPRDATALTTMHHAGDEFIVEWRALTVALLDELAPRVRVRLGRWTDEMPLACVLEGGTWAAGRALAQRLRGGAPPLNIESDGTVF